MQTVNRNLAGLRIVPWRLTYRTSALTPDGRPVDILHDFYIPALRLAVRYDRVAGYFRSTSLAAASQGFSAFVGRQGRMRVLVGADLDPDDVRAILAGTEARLTAALHAELEHPEAWPDDVTRGVELLAWMVAHDYLEVRVAFRVHTQTGEPLAMDACDDGYVHMKWAVFTDAHGNRLYASGSLNESRTALTRNAENLDVHCDWHGERDRQRVDEAEQEFELLWQNHHPAFRVLTLPEAVHRRLVRLAAGVSRPVEIDGSSAAPREIPPPSALEQLRFALLRDGPRLPGGRYVGMETAPITPWPHQAVVARRLIDTWPYSHLLCDEVGLGKTIEAGLAIRSLVLSGLVRRVLIAAPASLTPQWQRELQQKFLLPFGRALGGSSPRHAYLLPYEDERTASSLYAPDLVIVSTGLLTRQERRHDLTAAQPFDITLVDEAHYARRQNPTHGTRAAPRYGHLYTTVADRLRAASRSLWLATATPMQLDPVEVADLLRLTRRVGAFQFDPSLMLAYYEALGQLVRGQEVETPTWTFLRRAVRSVEAHDPLCWRFVEQAVIERRTELDVRRWLEHGRVPRGPSLQGVKRLLFAASPLSRVMMRHTRPLLDIYRDAGQLGANLARRHILPIPRIVFTDQERQAYDQLDTYCRGLAVQMAGQGGPRHQTAVGFLLSFLRLRFASSLFAIRQTLRRRLGRVEAAIDRLGLEDVADLDDLDLDDILEAGDGDDEAVRALLRDRAPADLHWEREQLRRMLATLADLSGASSKMHALLECLSRRRLGGGRLQQTVIFTRFYDTLTDIVERLRRVDPGMRLGTYSGRGGQYVEPRSGRLVAVDRETVKHRFVRRDIDVLVCTDAAAEGLNLQTADLLVNFDLPWNPMKVEQRIGRIDRIGQEHPDIYVLNLCYVDSAEQIVYGRLLQRLSDIGAIVGTQQFSLLPVTREEFQQLAEQTLTAAVLEQQARERAVLARRRTASMEMPPQELYETYVRLEQQMQQQHPPVDLDTIWATLAQSVYLRDLGCQVRAADEEQVFVLAGLPGLLDGTAVTTCRTTFDAGIAELEGRLHFATYGDPAFEAVLDQMASFDLPGCLRRLEVELPEVSVTVVGYAVAHRQDDGTTACLLVTSMQELDALRLDETHLLTDAEVEPLRRRLAVMAHQAWQTPQAVSRIEAVNEAAGHSQELLDYLVIDDFLRWRLRAGEADQGFWREAQVLDELVHDARMPSRVRRIPSAFARRLSDVLFDVTIPQTGTESRVEAPRLLLDAALDAACRLADSMRVRRSELRTEDVLARLDREVRRLCTRTKIFVPSPRRGEG
jgi:superfamily II DNA or RNA helicase